MLLSIVTALEHFRMYLYDPILHLHTANTSVQWLLNMKNHESQIVNLNERFQEYFFSLKRR